MKTTAEAPALDAAAPQRPSAALIRLPRSTKILPAHLAKLAIVYVRQSSPHQVLENRESTARQYALADYAKAMGWPAERVLVIDEDQGRSAVTAENRSGFQRLLAEVTMGHVGMVLGLETSRLARSSKDWHHLLEVCAIFGALLADQDGVYDPADPNDRLLLGLTGMMSEVELRTLRNRLDRGRLNKAQRGELFLNVPMGYVLHANGEVALDPDEQARSVVRLIFEKFDELGSARAVFYWFVEHGVSLPIRPREGPNKGEIEWRRANPSTVLQTLHHPMYAGVYAYGRRPVDPHASYSQGARRTQTWAPMDQWEVLIPDHLPAYITWERYLKNQERMKQNQTRPDTSGAPREGCALLGGLLVCGQCNWRMQVSYRTKDFPQYRCDRGHACAYTFGCNSVSANVIDDLVSRQVLRALEPAALELSLKAKSDIYRERQRLDQHWKQRLKRAQYDAGLAERRYQSVDPDNRLVAATLEAQWEAALRREREVQDEYDRFRQKALPELTEEDESQIRSLASDIPALWRAPNTTNADRKAIVRCLIERVVVHVERNSEHGDLTIHWMGGFESRLSFIRPVRVYQQLRDHDLLMKRIVELRKAGNTAAQTAATLNAEGFRPIAVNHSFNKDIVRALLLKLGYHDERNDDSLLGLHEWRLRDLARSLGMPWQTLREWATRGWVHSRRTAVQKVWIVWADDDEVDRLRKLLGGRRRGVYGYPSELTTPKSRPNQE